MLKSKNKEKVQSKILSTVTITFIFFMLMAFLIISSTSCSSLLGGATTGKTDVGTNQTANNKEENTSGETSAAQETVKEVDFTNATIGAEIKGYIPSYMLTDKDNFIRIEIKNTSDFTWRTEKPNLVRIGYHYYGQDVDFTDYDRTSRSVLPQDVKPGETVTIDVLINDIKNEGTYVIQIDPVMEGSNIAENNFWFSSKGVSMLEGTAYFGPRGK